MFGCKVDEEITIQLAEVRYAEQIFKLTDESRRYLRNWLPWLDQTKTVQDTENFIRQSLRDFAEQKSVNTVVFYRGEVAGIAGFNEIDWDNRIAYIGYWLGERFQGRGIMTKVCRALTDYAIYDLKLNKVDIRAAEANKKSRSIPERLCFTQEGKIRQAEWLYDHYVDHIVYGVLAEEWKMMHKKEGAME